MAAIAWSDVAMVAPELAAITDANIQNLYLDEVNSHFEVSLFGGEDSAKLKLMRCYLAAHMATDRGAGGTAGPVVGENLQGAASISYAGSRLIANASQYESTAYGRKLLALINASAARLPVVL